MQGSQNQHRFLPDQQTDFPFSVWAEEQGFVGVVLLLCLYLFLILWGLKIAAQAKEIATLKAQNAALRAELKPPLERSAHNQRSLLEVQNSKTTCADTQGKAVCINTRTR